MEREPIKFELPDDDSKGSNNDKIEKETETSTIKKGGRFEGVQFSELCKVLINAPSMSFYEAILEVGVENMPSIYDLASVKKFFYDKGRLDVLTKPGIIFEEVNPKLKQLSLGKNPVKNVAISSHLDNPGIQYMWTNEYLGTAPEGHPANGKVIMAKIAGIDMSKKIKHPMGALATADGMQQGKMIISDKEFTVIDKSKLNYTDDGFNYGIRWCGEIQGFEEIDGFMVPITFGRGPFGNEYIDSQTRYSEESKKSKPQGFGDIVYEVEGSPSPMGMRPSSWSQLGFNDKNPLNSKFKVLMKEDINKLK